MDWNWPLTGIYNELVIIRKAQTHMSALMDRINADMAAQKTIVGGFKAAMDALAQQLRDMATNNGGATPAELLNLATDIEANNATGAAALQDGIQPDAPPPS